MAARKCPRCGGALGDRYGPSLRAPTVDICEVCMGEEQHFDDLQKSLESPLKNVLADQERSWLNNLKGGE